MTTQLSTLVTRLDQTYPDGPPSEATVLGQGFDYLANHWLKRWPDDKPPSFLTPGARLHVDRADVFQRAHSVTTEQDVLELYVLMRSWGAGTKAQRIARCARVLHEPAAPALLLESLHDARDRGPHEAYRRLNTWGETRIKFFGPSFFTKWLYFTAYEPGADGPQPLILDALVATSLGWRSTGWKSTDYREYLQTAEKIRDAWAPQSRLDAIEYALFQTGRQLRSGQL